VKSIAYRGGIVRFSIPEDWVEEPATVAEVDLITGLIRAAEFAPGLGALAG
jgi:hypothetical protein